MRIRRRAAAAVRSLVHVRGCMSQVYPLPLGLTECTVPVTSSVNPMFMKRQEEAGDMANIMSKPLPPNPTGWVRVQNRMATLEQELQSMAEANRQLKQQAQAASVTSTASPVRRAKPRGRKQGGRHEFQQQRTRRSGKTRSARRGEAGEQSSSPSRSKRGAGAAGAGAGADEV